MRTLTATQARTEFYGLLTEVNESGEPVTITGRSGNGVLLSEADYRAIQATLYLLTVPGMRESIVEGLNTSLDDCSEIKFER